ncbi:MAG: hypothetical protein WBO28_09670 [Flavobacteriales bacterium]
MIITSLPWFALLLIANAALILTGGIGLADGIALIYFGAETIRLRRGGFAPSQSNSDALNQFLLIERNEWLANKLLGTAILVTTAFFTIGFDIALFVNAIITILSIEFLSTLLREIALRSKFAGLVSIAVLAILFMWSLNCLVGLSVSSYLVTNNFWNISWTSIFSNSTLGATIVISLFLCNIILLRLKPFRIPELLSKRFWLFK